MSIYLKTGKVLPEWTDYNGHMNLAYYIHLFDTSWEVLLQKFNIGEDSAKIEKRTTFAVESHTTYDMEVKVDDEVDMKNLIRAMVIHENGMQLSENTIDIGIAMANSMYTNGLD